MGKVYLFSPIGNTDPIKYFRDGSMLHICRHYKPDYVYLYMLKEILEFHRKDNRFVKSLEYLGEFLKHEFQVELIEREDLTDVQDYDFFYEEFQKEIAEIRGIMQPEDKLILSLRQFKFQVRKKVEIWILRNARNMMLRQFGN